MNGLAQIRRLLETQCLELTATLRKRDGILVERSPDAAENQIALVSRNASAQDLDRCSKKLRYTRRALELVDEGSYGICVDCGLEIPLKRLQAVLEAIRCCNCEDSFTNQTSFGKTH